MSSPPPRRWTRILSIAGIAVLTLVVTVLALLQLPPVATLVMRRVLTLVPLNPGYELEVGSVSGDWLHRLTLDEVRLVRNDRELVRLDRVYAGYDLRRVRGAEPTIRELTIEGADLVARRHGDTWDLANALRSSGDTGKKGSGGIRVEQLDIRGLDLVAEMNADSALRVRGLTLRARNLFVGERVLLDIDGLNAAVAPPGTTLSFAVSTRGSVAADELRFDPVLIQTEETRISGHIVLPRDFDDRQLIDRLDLRLEATPLALADLAAIVPAVTPEGELRLDARATGAADGLVTASLGARLDEATLTLNGVAPLASGRADHRLDVKLRRVDPSRLYRSAPAGSLTGTIEAELHGPALARSNGRVEVRLTPSRLAGTSIEGLNLRADLRDGSAGVVLRGDVEHGTLAATGRVRPFDSIPEYRLRGVAGNLPGTATIAGSLAGRAGEPVLDVHFQLAGVGVSSRDARISGKLEFVAQHQDGDQTPLGHTTVALASGRLDARPELLVAGGTITADVTARLGDSISYQVRRGTIQRVDLRRLVQDTSTAPVSGRFSLSGKGTTPAEAVVSGNVVLDELTYGPRRLEQIAAQARLSGGRARLELSGSLAGGRLSASGDGRPFDATKTFRLHRAELDDVDLGTLLERPDLAGAVTLRATGSARVRDEDRSFQGQLVIERSQLGRIEVAAGSLQAELYAKRLTYKGSIETNAGTVALEGDGRPLGEVRSLAIRRGTADSVDLGTLLGRPELRTAINARFSGSVGAERTDTMQTRLALQLLPSRVNDAELDSGLVNLNLDGGTLEGNLRLQGRDGELAAKVSGSTGSILTLQTTGAVRLERLARWTRRADTEGRIESSFALDAAADSAGLISVGGTIDAIGGIGDVRLHELHVALRPDSGAIHLDTLFMRSNVAALDGAGRIALRESAGLDTLRITGQTRDVAPLASLAGIDSISLDSARAAFTISGPAWQWRVGADAQVSRLLAGSNLAELVTVRGTAEFDSTRLDGVDGEIRVEDAAYGDVRIPSARLTGRYDSLLTAEAEVSAGDSIRLVAAMQGTVGDTLRARLHRLDLTEGGRDWSLEQAAMLQLRPTLVVDGLALRTGSRRIMVDGSFDPGGSSDITLRATNVDLDVFRSVGLAPIGGRLDGWLRLAGTGAAPTLEGSIGLGIRQKDGQEVGRIRSDLAWTRDALRIDATAVPSRGGRLTIDGTLPWGLILTPSDSGTTATAARGKSDSLSLTVRSDSFNLRVLEPLLPEESARELRGALVTNMRITGTPEAPRADGTVRITGAALEIPAVNVRYERGELVGRMEGDKLRVERLELRTGEDERLTASGVVRLRPLSNPALDLKAELTEFQIANSATLQSVASGTVELGGTVRLPTLTGRLTLGPSEITVGGGEASATVEKVELTQEDLRQLARHFGPAVLAEADDSPGLVDRFRLDLNLRLPGRVRFRKIGSPRVDVELAGRIRLRQEPGEPMELFGQVRPVPGRGTLDVYGREFRLTGGEITLAGPTDSTQLDVTAQYRVPTQGGPEDDGVVIDVAVSGHLDSLELEFTADPSMNQDDMLSYIVTGRPASENPLAEGTGNEQTAGEIGAEVALSALSGSLSEAAEEELGLDVFQIRQEGLHGLTLTAGRYIGSRLFLSLHMPIELAREQEPGTSLGPSFELEYAIRRWIRANIQGGNVPPRLTLRSRYAY